VQVSEGLRSYNDCSKLDQLSKSKLKEYLNPCPSTA
jgi:hypothetical protein